MRKFLSLLLTMAMVLSLAVTVNAAAPKEDITILHTNDVHCDYEKYAKVATLHKSADLLVDAGDHVQGGVIGTLSKGEYIVDIMNYLKYDAAVPGNHEFDYGMDQFLHIAKDLAKYPYISANFTGKDGKPYFDAYKMFEVKGVKVAFVGVCTPETFTKSTPTYFQDANGNYIYGFCEGNNGADLYKAVQKAIDAAKAAGADYVIGLGHLGIGNQVELLPFRLGGDGHGRRQPDVLKFSSPFLARMNWGEPFGGGRAEMLFGPPGGHLGEPLHRGIKIRKVIREDIVHLVEGFLHQLFTEHGTSSS